MAATSLPVVVVGASMAGLRTCEQLRSAGWDGPLTVIGAEAHMPYNRPPLSKHTGPAPRSVEEWLQGTEFRRRASLDDTSWRLGIAAHRVDLGAQTLTLADGSQLDYAGLVIATGLRPRRLPATAAAARRHVLRTIDDAAALYPQLQPGRRVVVIGGGFIGCEIAVTAVGHGCQVTVVEPQPAPMWAAFGPDLSTAVAAVHQDNAITFRTGVQVSAISDEPAEAVITLSDGTDLAADVIVESVGSQPNVEWLEGNGLDLTDGVLCDEHLSVVGGATAPARNVIAVGDIARFHNPRFGGAPRRVEHWFMPNDSAKHGARALVASLTGEPGPEQPFAPVPSFWSDQGELRIQGFGVPSIADISEVVTGTLDPDGLRAGAVIEYRRDDALVAIVSINIPPSQQSVHRSALARATDPFATPTGAKA
ncbi:FAD/NAD(P)-binding oxidoreductase [Mycobacterium sp. ACS4331]|uniref:NAD(P)/FAD-dependent oxidoreductase n=1 Tax=Mycobacterium sp. ACS4331 TaxID=1834121 RepID=UPI0007FBBF6F|nr:FAD/NAD(P)-binding oxidoreductase [Mycobacterium sp. ACS4331]OBF28005.1 hypothetical protein A5727_02700 [Mycobacterium sp. ACS4331]